ncbi:IGR protein motif protein [Niveomyces insectorum RCEF 264]|uniref:Small ribosomal subunit protein mS41 n=1 Tax=Niveomyces insectorum RCEF 264 TaxID=1081102 RepID=A0A167X4N4_9HYPO|nr:IGR protein motif protein [Niveomyces insectorum RCEF 264]
MNALRIRPASAGCFSAAPSRWAAAAAVAPPPNVTYQPTLLRRWAHKSSAAPADSRIPAPIPFVPDPETFLTIIGRNMKQHATKFPTWEALFTLTSPQLRELGIEPPRDRRYLLRCLERFRAGRHGIGGDFRFVRGGVAELRVHETVDPADPLKVYKTVVNVPPPPPPPAAAAADGKGEGEEATEEASATTSNAAAAAAPVGEAPGDPVPVRGFKVRGARAIAGPYALPLKAGEGARVTLTEGMWEDKRGRKIDGGERRRAEVRFKRRVAERRAEREQAGMI